MPWAGLLTPPEFADLDNAALADLKTKGVVTPYEKQFLHREGHRVNVLIGSAMLTGSQNLGVSCLVDISSQKLMMTQLKEAKEQAEISNRKKSEFLAIMSHELRTPLNAIIGYTEMLEMGVAGDLSEKQNKYNRYILSSGYHLLHLVNDILDVSRIEVGQLSLNKSWVEIHPLMQEILSTFQELAGRRHVTLQATIQPGITAIEADHVRLKQIFFNLIHNAIKFSRENGRVDIIVRLSDDNRFLVCEVHDEGTGIPSDFINELFKPFSQMDSSLSRQQEGTGLGLALSKRLVELHDGTINVESKMGVGSVFSFRLPYQPMPYEHLMKAQGPALQSTDANHQVKTTASV